MSFPVKHWHSPRREKTANAWLIKTGGFLGDLHGRKNGFAARLVVRQKTFCKFAKYFGGTFVVMLFLRF